MVTSLVWVTGASRGIGRALAASVPWPDAHVVGVSRTDPNLEALDEFVAADLSTPSGWEVVADSFRRAIASAAGRVERAALLHAASSVEPIGFAGETDPSAYGSAVLLNTVAPQVVGHEFLEATGGLKCRRHVVMLTSGASSGIYPGWSSYKAGKAAMEAWVEAEATANEDPALRIFAVAPGVVNTAMQDVIRAARPRDFPRRDRFVRLKDEGSLADPGTVASRIWGLVDSLHSVGPVVDLRDLPS